MDDEMKKHDPDNKLILLDVLEASRNLETTIETVSEISSKAEKVHSLTSMEAFIKKPNLVAVDIAVLSENCNHVSKLIPTIDENSDDYLADAMKKVIFENGKPNWEKLAKQVCCFSTTLSMGGLMLGHVPIADAKPKQGAKRTAPVGKEGLEKRSVTDYKFNRNTMDSANETFKQITQLLKTKGLEHIPYYQLIVDPNDFSNTVDNCFNLSFLVSKNALVIKNGADGLPQVRLFSKEEESKTKAESNDNQAICVLNTDICRRMIDLYDIKEPLLKTVSTHQEDKAGVDSDDADTDSDGDSDSESN